MTWAIPPGGVGLPDFDQRVRGSARPSSSRRLAGDDNALAVRFFGVLNVSNRGPERPTASRPYTGRAQLGQRLRNDDERLFGVAQFRRAIPGRIWLRVNTRRRPAARGHDAGEGN